MGRGKRKYSVIDGYTSKDLIHYGIDHLIGANYLFKLGHRAYDSAGYLAHLGVELIMKAILLFTQGHFTATHDLWSIYTDLSSLRKKWNLPKKHIDTLKFLNIFYELRYPKLKKPVEVGSDAWPRIEALFANLKKRMAKSLQAEIANINIFEKGGRILMSREKR